MIQHYLKIALRAVGFASFALSGMWVNYEQTYDIFHDGADRIYVARVPSALRGRIR